MKILAVDYGDSRTGLACCDRTEYLASPIGVIHEKVMGRVLQQVAAAAEEYEVGEIVVGSAGPRAKLCAQFAEDLERLVYVPVRLWDERGTTVSAAGYLNDTNTRGQKRKDVIEEVAATIILESYLAYRRNHVENK